MPVVPKYFTPERASKKSVIKGKGYYPNMWLGIFLIILWDRPEQFWAVSKLAKSTSRILRQHFFSKCSQSWQLIFSFL
jgi:hypothetical protein